MPEIATKLYDSPPSVNCSQNFVGRKRISAKKRQNLHLVDTESKVPRAATEIAAPKVSPVTSRFMAVYKLILAQFSHRVSRLQGVAASMLKFAASACL